MKNMVISLFIVCLCSIIAVSCVDDPKKFPFEGIGEHRLCGWDRGREFAICASEGKLFDCIVDPDARKVVCTEASAQIICTKIVNVETVCSDGKAPTPGL